MPTYNLLASCVMCALRGGGGGGINGVLHVVQLIHVVITRESKRLAVLSPLARCEALIYLTLFAGACAALACIQSSSSLAQITLSLHALCGSLLLPAIPP